MTDFVLNIFDLLVTAQYDRAIRLCEQTIADDPHNSTNYWYLGISYLFAKEAETAQATWMSALLESDNFDEQSQHLIKVLTDVAIKLINVQQLHLALLIYEQLIELDVDNLNNYYILALINRDLENFERSEFWLQQIINQDLSDFKIYQEYCSLLFKQHRYQEIIDILKKKKNVFEQLQDFHFLLMQALVKNGQAQDAIVHGEKALAIDPDNLMFQLENARILPILYESEAEIDFYRQRFIDCLHKISNNLSLDTDKDKKNALQAISLNTNFYLQYQGQNTLELQVKYGQLVTKIINANYPHLSINQKKQNQFNSGANDKIKVGYLSSKMFDNVIGELFSGWLKHHDSQQFEIHSYYIGEKNDSITNVYRENSHEFIQIHNNLERICQSIIDEQLDVLIFLDLGMSSELSKIAGLKLAPVQCKAWGPPITSGSPTIDYFLTSNLMESAQGEHHYSEKLVRLPNIAISYSPPKLPKFIKSRKHFNLPQDAVIYWNCQSLFKYLPQYDYIFPSIASQVKNSKFVFIKFPLSEFVNQQFENRLAQTFTQYGLNADDYCHFLPGLSADDFLNINLIADIGLDTFAWSGGKTALEAIACDLPVVTCPGEFMRGRHSYGILKMIEVEETIASSEEDYIDIAVKLGNDLNWREEISNKIKQNKHKLFNDRECIKGLEKFLIDVVKKKRD